MHIQSLKIVYTDSNSEVIAITKTRTVVIECSKVQLCDNETGHFY
jgi:hypothetical protein